MCDRFYIDLPLTFSPPFAYPGFFHRHTPANTCIMYRTCVHPHTSAHTHTGSYAYNSKKQVLFSLPLLGYIVLFNVILYEVQGDWGGGGGSTTVTCKNLPLSLTSICCNTFCLLCKNKNSLHHSTCHLLQQTSLLFLTFFVSFNCKKKGGGGGSWYMLLSS